MFWNGCTISDGDVVWMARDSLSFRSFLVLGAGDRMPDDMALMVFRQRDENNSPTTNNCNYSTLNWTRLGPGE